MNSRRVEALRLLSQLDDSATIGTPELADIFDVALTSLHHKPYRVKLLDCYGIEDGDRVGSHGRLRWGWGKVRKRLGDKIDGL